MCVYVGETEAMVGGNGDRGRRREGLGVSKSREFSSKVGGIRVSGVRVEGWPREGWG